jgi:hypothetical protein
MPLDATRATSKTTAINDALAAIGVEGDTAMPRCKARGVALAEERAAYRLFVAGHCRRRAETEWNAALALAVETGVIFDHREDPEPVGTDRVVFAGLVTEIRVTVAAPIAGVDHAGFVADLLKAGVKPALIKRLTGKHATETRPAHSFKPSLVTG